MQRIFIAILLGLIPVLNFVLAYYFSKREGLLKDFRHHFTCYYLDWIFIVFNFVFIYSITINFRIMFFMIFVSFLITLSMHIFWIKKADQMREIRGHMFDLKRKRITVAGIVHVVFMAFEFGLVLSLIFLGMNNLATYVGLLALGIFLVLGIYGSKRIHGHVTIDDFIFMGIGIAAVIIKFILII